MNEKLYEEIASTYRFFLSWRHAAFAGNLLVVYGATSLTLTALEKAPSIAWLVPALAAPIGVLLWVIDVRTRDLYHATIKAGTVVEGGVGALFTQLNRVAFPPGTSPLKHLSQSAAINVFFLGSSLVSAVLAVALYITGA